MIRRPVSRRDFLKRAGAYGLLLATPRFRPATSLAMPENSGIAFENIFKSSGVTFLHDNSAMPQKYQVETMAGGVGIFDYNNDGLLDLYFTNGARLPDFDKSQSKFFNRLYRNNGDGTFSDRTMESGLAGSNYSMGVAIADYDNDGNQDILVTGANGFQLFHNNGNGKFKDVTQEAGLLRTHPELAKGFSVSAGWFDYDNDGNLDLLVVNYLKWNPSIDPVCETKGIRSYCVPDAYAGLPNLLYHNNGDGTFTDVSLPSGFLDQIGKGMGVAFGDYDNDGFVDVFVANDTLRNFLFHNNGDGTFTESGVLNGVAYPENGKRVAGMGADFRDVNNTGYPDIFETAMLGDVFPYFRNLGNGSFEYDSFPSHIARVTGRLTAWGTGIYDFDNDGWKDIFTANGSILDNSEAINGVPFRLANSLMKNNRDGTFSDVSLGCGKDFLAANAHRGAAFGDLDNDGQVDIVTSSLNSNPEILMNRTKNENHWLLVNLIGTRSNRDGLGAKLKLTTANGAQFNHATTAVGYASSSDKRVHFGLGKASKADKIEISWPSGVRQIVADVPANQVITVREPVPSQK
jgi:hypothetical protein